MRKLLSLILLILLIPSLCFGAASRSFDGTNDEVDMGNVLDVTTGDVSVCSWIKMTEDAGSDWILGKMNGPGTVGNAGYQLSQVAADTLQVRFSDGTTSVTSASTTDPDGVWVFACGTYLASTETSRMYVNGIQEDTDAGAGDIDSLTNAVNLTFGQDGANGTDMVGLADYGTQFNSVLTVVEIAELMWKPESVGTSRGGFWPLWGDATEIDLNGTGLTGTVTGATTSSDGPPVMWGGLPL